MRSCLLLVILLTTSLLSGQMLQSISTSQAATTPTFSPAAGAVSNPTTVTLSSSPECASYIHHNTTGSPVISDPTGTYSVTGAVTLYGKTIGCPGHGDSAVGSAAYTISGGGGLPGTQAFGYEARLGNNCGTVGTPAACSDGNDANNPQDQSGNANTLIPQGSAPVYHVNIFGTTAAFTFNGVSTNWSFTSAVNFQSNSTVCAVIKNTSTVAKGTILSGPSASFTYWTANGGKEQGADKTAIAELGSGTAAQSTNAHLVCYTFNGTNDLKFYLDGAGDGTLTPSTTITANETSVGINNDSEPFNGHIGMLYGWARILNSAELAAVHTYASTNYGTP